MAPAQTHTGDYNGAEWPFQCRAIGGRPDAVTLHTNGTLSSDDPELQVRSRTAPLLPCPARPLGVLLKLPGQCTGTQMEQIYPDVCMEGYKVFCSMQSHGKEYVQCHAAAMTSKLRKAGHLTAIWLITGCSMSGIVSCWWSAVSLAGVLGASLWYCHKDTSIVNMLWPSRQRWVI